MTDNQRQNLFEKWAATYDHSVQDKKSFPFAGYDQVLETIVEQADLQSSNSVLDLGTGTGNLAARLLKKTLRVVGADFSGEMLIKAREKLPGARFVQLDLLSDDWSALENQRFDRVVAAYVLHEFPLARVVEIIQRLKQDHLNEKGRIVFGDIAFSSVTIRDQARLQWGKDWDKDEFYWAADEAVQAFEPIGLRTQFQKISWCGGVFTLDPFL
jgi:putative AdoMet-dependent methyltransferase